MQVLILSVLVAAAVAAPQSGYQLPQPQQQSFSHGGGSVGGGFVGGGGFSSGGAVGGGGYSGGGGGGGGGFSGGFSGDCGNGQVRHVDGSCVEPIVNRNIYVYAAPQRQIQRGPRPEIPKPRVNYNIVFVRTPEVSDHQEPIVIPPAREQTLVYVLSKNRELGSQVIEIPDQPPQTPEVYYVNYNEGENPQLPGGLDLQSALASANAQQGQSIDSGAGFGGGFVSGHSAGGSVGGGFVGGAVGGGFVGGSVGGGSVGQSYSQPQQPSQTYQA